MENKIVHVGDNTIPSHFFVQLIRLPLIKTESFVFSTKIYCQMYLNFKLFWETNKTPDPDIEQIVKDIGIMMGF